MKKLLLALLVLLTGISSSFAQRVDADKKTGLITVDGRPSFYLTGKNRALFTADFSLENLQRQELAYLKALQRQVFNPSTGYTTQTYYSVTFSQSGNYCEIYDFSSLSYFKSLAKTIAAAGLVQNNTISQPAEQKFIVMYNGVFLRDPNNDRFEDDGIVREGRGSNRRYDDRRGNNDDRFDDRRGNGRYDNDPRDRRDNDNRYDDRRNNGRNNNDQDDRDPRDRRDDRYNDGRNNNNNNNDRDDRNVDGPPPPPVKISLANNKVFDNNEQIGTYKQTNGATKNDVVITIYDMDNRKAATARRTAAASKTWQITLDDGTKVSTPYAADSPLVKLFTYLAEQGYL